MDMARVLVWTIVAGLAVSPLGAAGQDADKAEPAADDKAAAVDKAPPAQTEAVPADKPLRGPKYLNLRCDEDYTYLDGEPGTYREDFFDPIKNIHLGDDWRLTLGGEFRYRMEAETNKAFGARARTQDTFNLYRYMIHADLKYKDVFRVFAQGATSYDDERDYAPRGIDENRWDLQQLFVDVKVLGPELPLTLRVGRQELQYGKQRFLSPLEWANVRRRFDAVKLFAHGEKWDVDMWYAKPVPVQRKQRDRWDEEFDFYGLYVTYKGIPRHGIDAYFLASDRTADRRNPNGKIGDESRYTLGARFWGKTAGFDYDAELAGQWGRWAGDTVQAWSWSLNGGYTFADWWATPRIGAGFDWSSGDEDPRDGKVGTFDQLFPLGHAYFGFLDLVGRQNVTAVNVNLTAWPIKKKVKTAIAYHTFWLNDKRDALYNVGGAPGRRDATGHSGTEIGHEVDVTVVWNICPHSAMLFGYSHFWDSDFIVHTGSSEDPDLFYIQYRFRF